MKKHIFYCCALAGLMSLACCTKSTVAEPENESSDVLVASISDPATKTSLEGLDVKWAKGDEIAIQLSSIHTDNAIFRKDAASHVATSGVYRLADDAAGTKVGSFAWSSGEERIGDEDEFFAFYPAEYSKGQTGNGYFYMRFPATQYYEDNIGDNLVLPMYGIGKDREIEFSYAGAVIRIKVWSKEDVRINSCTLKNETELPGAIFSYIAADGKWKAQNMVYGTGICSLSMSMRNPLTVSNDAANPTEIVFVLPLVQPTILKSLTFSINGDKGGCAISRTKDLTVSPGDAVSFGAKEISFQSVKMSVDGGVEEDFDVDRIKDASAKVSVVTPEGAMLSREMFNSVMLATKSLNHQIVVDFSKTNAGFSSLMDYPNSDDVNYEEKKANWVCGGRQNQGLHNVSELILPEGITYLGNMSLAGSDYKKVVLPSTLKTISGFPSRYDDNMLWEVNAGNKTFKADDKGALYSYDMTQLMVLNGGSGDAYVVPEGTESIRSWALYDNSVLKTLTLPKSMKTLNSSSIDGTRNLSTIICLGETPATIGNMNKNSVGGTGVEKTIYVPGGATDAYKAAWGILVDPENGQGWVIKTLDSAVKAGFTVSTPKSESVEF